MATDIGMGILAAMFRCAWAPAMVMAALCGGLRIAIARTVLGGIRDGTISIGISADAVIAGDACRGLFLR